MTVARPDTFAARAALEARRAELLMRIDAVQDSLSEERDRDLEDQAIERESDEVLDALGLSDRHEIEMIGAALERIDAGTYGECVKCGEPIGAARLAALPATPLCVKCAGGARTA